MTTPVSPDLFPSRAKLLANHLRTRILANEWPEPLPNMLDWSRQLAVGKHTLCAALNLLRKEGLLEIQKYQGIRLKRKARRLASAQVGHLVRILYYGVDYPLDGHFVQFAGPLAEVLQKRGGQLRVERHSDEHLSEICRARSERASGAADLLLPLGVPAKYQRMLAVSGRPCIYVGIPMEGVELPFIRCDLPGAIRHATHTLIRRGFQKLTFILGKTHGSGTLAMQREFLAACREWSGDAIDGKILQVRMHEQEERRALTQFASQVSIPHGILTLPPMSPSLVATSLLAENIRLPSQVDIIVIASAPESIRVHPPLTHYPFPMELFIKTLANAIFSFWESGKAPGIKRILPLEMVSPRRD